MVKVIKKTVLVTYLIALTSCSMLNPLSSLPNPLEADKGINTNVALGKNVEANSTKGLVTLDKIDIGRDASTNTNTANEMIINNGMDKRMLIFVVLLVLIIIFLAGMAIPTRGQANRIRELKENLDYERARTNITIEASAEGQRAGHTQNRK